MTRRDRGHLSVTDSQFCLGLLPRMAAVPSDNAHAATPHHLRNKGPHASTQSPAHHTSWTAPSHSCPSSPGCQLASNERAGTARETRGPAYLIGHAQGRLRAGLSLCHEAVPCQDDLGPALGDEELFLPMKPAISERSRNLISD